MNGWLRVSNRNEQQVFVDGGIQQFEKDFRNRQVGVNIGYNTREYQSIETGVQVAKLRCRLLLWTAARATR